MDDHPIRARVMDGARAALDRVAAGGPVDAEAIADAPLPDADPGLPARLGELLPGTGPLADRIAAHRASAAIPPDAVADVAERLLQLLNERAEEDLDLPDGVLPLPDGFADRVLDGRASWTPDELAAALARDVVPGRLLAGRLRREVESGLSPATTVDRGRELVGREVLLADHELAHELTALGRRIGRRWDGDRLLRVRAALDERAPAVAVAALADPGTDPAAALSPLGFDGAERRRLAASWAADPLARVEALASAAGPPLVRAWLVATGQTAGLRRLLHEPLVPSELRDDLRALDA